MKIADNYFTISQLADAYGVTRQTVSRWIKQGKIKGEKVGREILINKSGISLKQCLTCKHWYWSE